MASRSKTSHPSRIFLSDARELLCAVSPSERIALINLGCARNLVDSEILLGGLKAKGASLSNLQEADTVLVNTCAFVSDAKQETIDTILALIDLKRKKKIKRIVVMGCFSQRYAQVFGQEFPEVDHVFGVLSLKSQGKSARTLLTPASYAYLKICEGCYNQCSFCAIPQIKGPLVSRPIDDIAHEAKKLEEKGFQEIDIIGQDITAYGVDLYHRKSLARLLSVLLKRTKRVRWFRLLYAFPKHITDDLLVLMAQEERICQYIDVPFQHINDDILSSMNRNFSRSQTLRLIDKIRRIVPLAALRTALIVGYPGETEKAFDELCAFVRDVQFDRLGVFVYSPEEGTRSFQILDQIPGKVKQERYNTLMQLQQKISRRRLKRFVGQEMKILVDAAKSDHVFIGRSQYDAPEVDGVVNVKATRPLRVGEMVTVKISKSSEYDLFAKY